MPYVYDIYAYLWDVCYEWASAKKAATETYHVGSTTVAYIEYIFKHAVYGQEARYKTK